MCTVVIIFCNLPLKLREIVVQDVKKFLCNQRKPIINILSSSSSLFFRGNIRNSAISLAIIANTGDMVGEPVAAGYVSDLTQHIVWGVQVFIHRIIKNLRTHYKWWLYSCQLEVWLSSYKVSMQPVQRISSKLNMLETRIFYIFPIHWIRQFICDY